jgi:hypothetical protein
MADQRSLMATRFAQLAEQAKKMHAHEFEGAPQQEFFTWAASVINLLKGAMGSDSPHAQQFQSQLDNLENNYVSDRTLDASRGIFFGAKADFDGGFLFNTAISLSAEIFGDFVGAAKAALADGHHTVACVLASAALEDALKRYATNCGLDVTGNSMTETVNALKSKGLVSGAQKSLLGSMPKIRDFAMHAEWDKLTPQDAGSIIGFVEQFLLTQFHSPTTPA